MSELGSSAGGRGFFRTNRRLKSTRQGKWFVGITLALGVGVLNSGNNLLFLCLGLLLSVITISGILSEMNVRDLALDVHTDGLAFAGAPHTVEFVVRNLHKRRHVFSLAFNVSTKPGDVHLEREVTILHIPPGATGSIRGTLTFAKRGEYSIDEVLVQTEYPFGLFNKMRVFLPALRVTVAPAPQVPRIDDRLPPRAWGEHVRNQPGSAIEPFDVREAVPGEDIRNISWSKSAGRQNLIAIRRANDASDAAILALHGHAGEPIFEERLSLATGYLLARMRDGAPTGLWLGDAQAPVGVGAAHERALLKLLATAQRGAEGQRQQTRAAIVWIGEA